MGCIRCVLPGHGSDRVCIGFGGKTERGRRICNAFSVGNNPNDAKPQVALDAQPGADRFNPAWDSADRFNPAWD
jgi:hypothetical protein